MNENIALDEIRQEIDSFIREYQGTAIGQSVYNMECNTGDDDYDGMYKIYKVLEDMGYV